MRKRHIYSLLLAALLLVAACGQRGDKAPVRHARAEACAETVATAANDTALTADTAAQPNREFQRVDLALHVKRGKAFVLHTEGLLLEASDTALLHDATLSVTALRAGETAPLPSDHANVTGGSGEAYRLLPSGRHFEPYAELRVAYDEEKLPFGYTPEDIYTSYYNEAQQQWVRLERVEVDTANREIVSLTDHFTDFVNEVLKAPDMPETQAFVPTMMSELEAASPLAGLTLIEPPTANNSGTANLSYSIELPAGRRGMQPSLALSYSSGGGQGWLGVGWDIAIPSISVETRWGVPRYDRGKESEVYLYNGEQLITKGADGEFLPMPHRTNQWQQRQAGPTQYWPRVDEAHDSIVRHGSAPDNYWWEVTDRSGVTHIYGRDSASHVATLRTDRGDIARWMLTESRDPYGNSVRYCYDTVRDAGVAGQQVQGVQIYPACITYTNHGTEEGIYKVIFYREDNQRSRERSERMKGPVHEEDYNAPVTISGRNGLKEVTSSLLSHIDIVARDTVVREYVMGMECDATTQYKPLLRNVTVAYPHRMRTPEEGAMSIYTNTKGVLSRGRDLGRTLNFEYHDTPEALFGPPVEIDLNESDTLEDFFSRFSPIGAETDWDSRALGSSRGYGFNVGGGANVGFGYNVFCTELSAGATLGTGVRRDNGSVAFVDIDGDGLPDKLYRTVLGNLYYRKHIPDERGFHLGPPRRIQGMRNYNSTNTWSRDLGLNVQVAVNATASKTWSDSWTHHYLADVNADGLVDIVSDTGVYFNYLDENGVPTFTKSPHQGDPDIVDTIRIASSPCGYIIYDGLADERIHCPRERKLKDKRVDTQANVVSLAELIEQHFTSQGYTMDSIKCAELHSTGGVYHLYGHKDSLLCDQRDQASKFFPDYEAVRVWVAPMDGTVQVTSQMAMLPDRTEGLARSRRADGVNCVVQHDRGVTSRPDGTLRASATERVAALSDTLAPSDTNTVTRQADISVRAGDILYFRLQSGRNNHFDRVRWKQRIKYADSDSWGRDGYGVHSGTYDSDSDFVVQGQHHYQAPDNGTVRLDLDIVSQDLLNPVAVEVRLNGTLQQVAGLPAQIPSRYPATRYTHDMPVQEGTSIEVVLRAVGGSNTTWSNIQCQPHYHFTPATEDSDFGTMHLDIAAHMDMATGYGAAYRDLFGPLYRGWGQFCHNADGANPDNNIHLAELKSTSGQVHTVSQLGDEENLPDLGLENEEVSFETLTTGMFNRGFPNPLDPGLTRWVSMEPDSKNWAWVNFGRTAAIARGMMTNTIPREFYADARTMDIIEIDNPIPAPSAVYPKVKTHAKKSRSTSWAVSGSLSVASVGGGVSYTRSETRSESEYLDLNGDRYPDLVGIGGMQYTMPYGGLGDSIHGIDLDSSSSQSTSCQLSVNCNGTDGNTHVLQPMFGRTARGDANTASPGLDKPSPSGSATRSSDQTYSTFLDLNGDGLPDKVYNNGEVALNIGYRFLVQEHWSALSTHSNHCWSGSVSCSGAYKPFNLKDYSISGGISLNFSDSQTEHLLLDLNGDGLPDAVEKENGTVTVRYNYGNGLWSNPETLDVSSIGHNTSYNEALSGSVTAGGTIGLCKITGTLSGSPYSRTYTCDHVQLADIDGDGLVDYVESRGSDRLRVRYNQTGKARLLSKAVNVTGGEINIDYAYVGPTYESPQGQWVMSKCSVVEGRDNSVPAMSTTYEYRNPHYDRYERTGYGFDTVIATQWDGSTAYRCTVEGYHNRSYGKRGRKRSESTNAALPNGAPGSRYAEKLYDIVYDEISVQGDCPQRYLASKEAVITNIYEGAAQPRLTTAKSYVYDRYRNVVTYENRGDTLVLGDELRMDMEYLPGQPRNMVSLKSKVRVTQSGSSVPLRESLFSYDSRGSLTQRDDAYAAGQYATTNLDYDSRGNLISATLPANERGQRMTYTYTYDPVAHTYPTEVSNSFGHHSRTTYSYLFGLPLAVTDVAQNTVSYSYDIAGRLVSVLAPREAATGAPYTWRAEYPGTLDHPTEPDRCRGFALFSGYARTYHYDEQHPSDPIATTTFCDSWGRVMQVQADACVDGQDGSVWSGRVRYDALGRAVAQYDVSFTLPNTMPVPSYVVKSTTTYDILDRPLTQTLYDGVSPNGITSTTAYSVQNRQMVTATTDPLGNTTYAYKDGRGLQTKVVDAAGHTTQFRYDNLGQLLSSTDPEGISTYYHYDRLGRLTQRNHPDAGTTSITYSPLGLPVTTTNATGDVVRNYYDFHRLDSTKYSRLPGNDVRYKYNQYGRVSEIQDGSGKQMLNYDEMGNVSENIRTFAIPNATNTYTFRMLFEYDSWNRAQTITYPDGEVVNYEYDAGGNLVHVYGDKGQEHFDYVSKHLYNKYGQRSKLEYGNGTHTEYTYDNLQRLSQLTSYDAQGNAMQDIKYTFDNVSNITHVENIASAIGTLGGQYSNEYVYDNIYRLTDATQSYGHGNYLTMSYSPNGRVLEKDQTHTQQQLSYAYCPEQQPHAIRRILNAQSNELLDLQWDANGNLAQVNHYEKTGELYEHSRFLHWTEDNRLSSVVDPRHFSYYGYDCSGERTLKLTGDCTLLDINADRMIVSANLDRVTLYTSPYLVATGRGYTKHIYAGAERVCAKTGSGGFDDMCLLRKADARLLGNALDLFETVRGEMGIAQMGEPCKEAEDALLQMELESPAAAVHAQTVIDASLFDATMSRLASVPTQAPIMVVTEPDLYFYHSDHLGSASWITDANGTAIQHIQYCPYGEPFVDQHTGSYMERFTFTGKERDEETGYHYFGARYLDADLMTGWLSVDPMSDKYPSLSPYNYCAWNPMRFVDYTGEDIYELDDNGMFQQQKKANYDCFVVIHQDGSRTESGHYKKGTIISYKRTALSPSSSMDRYKIRGDENAKEIFEFLAGNTNVEWTHVMTGIAGDKGLNFVSTSHNRNSEKSFYQLFQNQLKHGYTIREINHNHPKGTKIPSGSKDNHLTGQKAGTYGDVVMAKQIECEYRKKHASTPVFNILTISGNTPEYSPYDSTTRY